ncbi:unnamed protein product [Owenia fusiformis]|uniref:Uncharacterized protein n=1 Tax=Owenia fusiformis TaxID=6347 RepID=A0A8J1UCM4_OWEFU|nr:unnamed protein product [Owenia fusiformis]
MTGNPRRFEDNAPTILEMEIMPESKHETQEELKEHTEPATDTRNTYQAPQKQQSEDDEDVGIPLDLDTDIESEISNGVNIGTTSDITFTKVETNEDVKLNTEVKIHKPQNTESKYNDDTDTIHNNEKKCTPRKNICFLKVHKCAGSTVTNIFQRYGKDHKLRFVLPGNDVNLGYPKRFTYNKGINESFNLLVNHAVFHEINMRAILPNDTIFIGIWRDPLQHLLSVYSWFNLEKRHGYPPLDDFIRDPGRYNITTGHDSSMHSLAKNFMTFHYGFNPMVEYSKTELVNMTQYLDKTFSFFIIVEFMNESLLLLRQLLCWTYKDILYLSHKVNGSFKENSHKTYSSKNILEHSKTDAYFYHHYKQVLLEKINSKGERLQKELVAYEDVLSQTIDFCSYNVTLSETIVQSPPVIEAILLTRDDCHWMTLKPKQFVPILRSLQSPYTD